MFTIQNLGRGIGKLVPAPFGDEELVNAALDILDENRRILDQAKKEFPGIFQ